ncbi:ABC transporter substrate-binding protein [Konateibacter massiliensis]|uniref:ABC transporter substrate-binding protein n=1 Tax=Konateibacter massiliensis TaxID=2002841 RepID=UPI0015D4EE84|nr:extracellular solute-binding protein [Konateibacter massiliensis]
MGKGRRYVIAALIILAVVAVLFLRNRDKTVIKEPEIAENEEVTLRIYAQYADDETKFPYDYAVEKLKEAYPNIKLELDIQAQDDGDKLQTYAVTGNLPDIYQAGRQQIHSFKTSGNIMILNDAAKSTGFLDKVSENAESILYDTDGNIYAFPYAGNEVVVWYYNKALFEEYNLEVPKTYEELLTVIKVFKENGIIPMALFGKEKWVTTAFYDIIATRFEREGIDKLDKGNERMLSDGYAQAAEIVSQMAHAGLFSDNVTSITYDQASELFYSGKAAMMINGQWEMESAYKAMGEDVDWMYYPSYDLESYESTKDVWVGGGTIGGYAVNPNSPNSELAVEVAAFLAEKYCEAKYIYQSNPFVTLDISDNPINPFNNMTKRLLEETKEASYTRFTWGLSNADFKKAIEEQSQLLLIPQYTSEEFINQMNQVLDKLTSD